MARAPRDVQGLAEAYSLFDALPSAAEQELAVEMATIGRELLAAQKADVEKDTGALEAALSLQLLLSRLKVRVGLIGRSGRTRRGWPYYGRFVEFGRHEQIVVVTRRLKRRRARNKGTQSTPLRLRRRGKNGNAGTPVGSAYKLRVKPMDARPFIAQPFLADVADAHLSDFWADTLARIGAKS